MAHTHLAWDPSRVRKLRKKYGNLVKSPRSNLNEMLAEHQQEVFDLLLSETEEWRTTQRQKELEEETLARATMTMPGVGIGVGLGGQPQQSVIVTGIQRPGNGGSGFTMERSRSLNSPLPQTSTPLGKSPRGPPIGMFSVGSGSPRSPVKR